MTLTHSLSSTPNIRRSVDIIFLSLWYLTSSFWTRSLVLIQVSVSVQSTFFITCNERRRLSSFPQTDLEINADNRTSTLAIRQNLLCTDIDDMPIPRVDVSIKAAS